MLNLTKIKLKNKKKLKKYSYDMQNYYSFVKRRKLRRKKKIEL